MSENQEAKNESSLNEKESSQALNENQEKQEVKNPAVEAVSQKVGDSIENISGVDVSEEVRAFITASKNLIDAIFSGITGKIEQKINDFVKNLMK